MTTPSICEVVIAASCLCDPDRTSDLTACSVPASIYICSVNRETCFLLAPLSKLITDPWDLGPSSTFAF